MFATPTLFPFLFPLPASSPPYLLFLNAPEVRTNAHQRRHGLRIVALSDDFLEPTTDVYSWPLEGGNRVEAPAMVKLGNTYFLFASMMTGEASDR
jgi:hypothetical protein